MVRRVIRWLDNNFTDIMLQLVELQAEAHGHGHVPPTHVGPASPVQAADTQHDAVTVTAVASAVAALEVRRAANAEPWAPSGPLKIDARVCSVLLRPHLD